MVEQVFFQSSLPRSGSTLFQNLVSQNPDFYVTPTSPLLEYWFAARGNYSTTPEVKAQDSETMRNAFAGFCREGMFGFFNAITDKKYVLDKSRGHGVYRPFIETFYPEPKVICLVRDLRDVFCSYEKIYRKTQDKHDPVRNDAQARGTTVHKRIDEWANPQNTIGRAVERLFEITRLGYQDKILFIKYEDLCLHPETEMTRFYEYIGLPYFEHDFENIPQTTKEDDEVYGLSPDLHTIQPKLKLTKSEAYSILGADICKWIKENYKWFFDMFNYK